MYSRASFLPSSRFLLFFSLVLCLFVAIFGSLSMSAQSASSGVEIVYALEGSTLQTYDVDRQTGSATEQGQGVTLDTALGLIVASADGRFLYVTGNSGGEYLWVYATDATGVPQLPAIQTLSLENTYSPLMINPDGTLAYAVESSQTYRFETLDGVRAFAINPMTGMVQEESQPVETFPPNGPCKVGVQAAGFAIVAFSPDGSQMYGTWGCGYYDVETGTYYSQAVNQKTGALGPQTQIFNWTSASNSSTNLTNITPSAILSFDVPNDFNYGISSLGVSSLGGSPLFTCTAAMLEACGYATWDTVDPSGRFILFQISADSTQITRLELAQKKIADTGNYVDGTVMGISPDDALIYTLDEQLINSFPYTVYVFDPATGAVTYTGGQIVLSTYPNQFLPAVRR
jgi:hypothetical protein